MGEEGNEKKTQKLVLLVEDKLSPLHNILLSIQTILFVANKQGLKNSPQNMDTEIRVLHLIGRGKVGDQEHFDRFKRALEGREQDECGISKLDYQYQPLEWDKEDYPQNCKRCAGELEGQIEEICKGKDYSIILDAILVDTVDESELANGRQILSQLLFEHFREHCIPYTNYGQGTKHIRKAWASGVNLNYEMFQRQYIVADAIYKPFRKMLYNQLRIGDTTP